MLLIVAECYLVLRILTPEHSTTLSYRTLWVFTRLNSDINYNVVVGYINAISIS